jgi:hypothetical protein
LGVIRDATQHRNCGKFLISIIKIILVGLSNLSLTPPTREFSEKKDHTVVLETAAPHFLHLGDNPDTDLPLFSTTMVTNLQSPTLLYQVPSSSRLHSLVERGSGFIKLRRTHSLSGDRFSFYMSIQGYTLE